MSGLYIFSLPPDKIYYNSRLLGNNHWIKYDITQSTYKAKYAHKYLIVIGRNFVKSYHYALQCALLLAQTLSDRKKGKRADVAAL